MRRICERQNRKAQCATDAKHLDFGIIIPHFPIQKKSYVSLISTQSSMGVIFILLDLTLMDLST